MARRTQQQRREATIAKLLDATIECLIEHGYRGSSIGQITKRAGVSHGGLFRHFSSRTALLAATTEEIARRHLSGLHRLVEGPPSGDDPIEALVTFITRTSRSPLTAAWREVIVASRTDPDLRHQITPSIQYIEDSVMELAGHLPFIPAS